MRDRKLVRGLFIAIFPFLFLQLLYGVVVREPYPSMIMPGFSGVKGNARIMTTLKRTFIVHFDDGEVDSLGMEDMFKGMSNVGSGRLLDRTVFTSKQKREEHRTRKGADRIVESLLGSAFMDYVYRERYPLVKPEDQELYRKWLLNRAAEITGREDLDFLVIERFDETRNLQTRALIRRQLRDSAIISHE